MNPEAIQRYRAILRAPVFNEKTFRDQERRNAYHFDVAPNANKVEIRRAIEALFNVKVKAVRTLLRKGKVVRRGLMIGTKPAAKRAIVTLRAGQSIEYV
jgi:large subunit ribosomal protein L23